MSQNSSRSALALLALALLAGAPRPASAQVVIHEIMQNPAAVGDSAGEWFEIYNPTGAAIDVEGWTIADNDVDSHLIANGGPLLVPAGGYLVLGNNDDSGTNGGVTVDYDYGSSFFLANGADELVLFDQTLTEIDRVEWDGGPAFPDPTGASMALASPGLDNDVGANWCTSSTPFGAGDLGTPGAANDCPVPVPEIVIHEIMQNPSAVADADGEWLELYNAGAAAVDLDGWTIEDNGSDSHTIVNGGPLLIPAGGYLVLGRNADSGTNGGVSVDYEYSGFTLANGDDEVILLDVPANEVDRVEYDGGPAFPDPNGATMALIDPGLDNNVGANWCTATTPFGDGDAGTPGAANDCVVEPAAVLVINEIMQNPSAVSDGAGEWFEIYNPGAAAVDVDGWTIADNDSDSHLITNGGPLVVPAGGYLVLGNNDDSGTNGGLTVDYDYGGSFFLANGADELVLFDPTLVEIDRVEWDGGPAFPDPNGASMALANPALDNNDGANWCTAQTPFGAGDLGTPGAVNDCPAPELVINEIMQNPSAVSDGSGEWLELFNPTGSPVDVDGWTLSDDGADSHVIANGGPLLVPAGGYLVLGNNADSGTNGGVSVDYEYSGFFLANGDDEVVLFDTLANEIDRVNYDGGPAFPDPTGASMALAIPGLDNNDGANWCTSSTPFGAGDFGTAGAVNDCPGIEIYEIQGSGGVSPFENLAVITRDNVVTGVAGNGFFIQTPTARDDLDATTSNGIFVFTSSAPGVVEGDLVDVVGTVREFFELTELDDDGLSVIVTASGEPLPAPVLLDALNPDPGPFDPPDMERFEGMLVELDGGMATAPTDNFGDTAVVVGSDRTFREPGIEFPSPFVGLPEWDANQEVFEVNPDGLAGMPDADIFPTRSVSAIGPLTFSFGDYQILPQALVLGPEPTVLDPVRARQPGELTVGTFNIFRLNGGFAKLSAYVTGVLRSPDILAIQEVQDIGELEDLADQIAIDDPTVSYDAWLVEGNDVGGIDVGFLTRSNVQVDAITQLGALETLSVDGSLLHDRPPLLLEGSCELEFGSYPIAVMVLHMRSLGGIDDPADGPRVRQKRFEQAESVAEKIQDIQDADPDVRLMVVGDFNAYEFTDGYVDVTGIIKGDFTPADNLICDTNVCADLVDPDLFDEVLGLPSGERYSFVFDGNAQVLDHAVTTVALAAEISGAEYGRGNSDAYADLLSDMTPANLPLRSSDHDGFVLYILKDEDADGVPNDDDVCAGTQIPESVPTKGLKPNRYALVDGDGVFDSGGGGAGDVFTLGDTAGCSCEQIIIAQGLGQGHVKHGCSIGAMRDWIDLVNP